MSDKRKKGLVVKKGKKIEVSLSEQLPSSAKLMKYEIMKAIAQHHTVYGATVWLNTPLEEIGLKTPAELMLEGDLEAVAALVSKFKDDRKDK
mgnify:CR=1 FL=1